MTVRRLLACAIALLATTSAAALRLAHVDALRINDKPLTAQDTAQICRSVAALASEKRLARLRLPSAGTEQDPDRPLAGWSLTAKEKQTLAHGKGWLYGVPNDLYRIKLTASGKAARYGSFTTGGSCASYQMANVDQVLAGLRSGKDVDGEINDDESRRWEYWGGGDYPIVLNGRNLLITADLGDSNQPSSVSWLKPDSSIESICTMSIKAAYNKVVDSHDDTVCHGVAEGRITALPTLHVDHGGYAEEVALLPRNPSGDGSGERWAVFTSHSGGGCGGTWKWLRVLTPDLGKATSHELNKVPTEQFWRNVNVYEHGRARYVEILDRHGNGKLLRSGAGSRVEQVCRFEGHQEFRVDRGRPSLSAPSGVVAKESKKAHQTGRRYVEIVVNPEALPIMFDTTLNVSIGNNPGGVLIEQLLRRTRTSPDAPRQQRVIGLAIDFDAGRLYRHQDNVWLEGAPASGRGLDVPRGDPARVAIWTEPNGLLNTARQSPAVQINFGERPFRLKPPAGYVGFDANGTDSSGTR